MIFDMAEIENSLSSGNFSQCKPLPLYQSNRYQSSHPARLLVAAASF
jgi:hypothetical protein